MKNASAAPDIHQSNTKSSWRSDPYALVLFFLLSLIIAWSLLRGLLVVQYGNEVQAPATEVWRAFAAGLHRDLIAGLLFCIPITGWLLLIGCQSFGKSWHRQSFWLGFFVFWIVEVFLMAAEYFFFDEFRSRFNTVAIDYLLYPHEVFINIWESYPVSLVLAVCGALSAVWVLIASRLFHPMWHCPAGLRRRGVMFAGVASLCLLLGNTISLKGPRLSNERLVNEFANNGVLSFAAAAWTHHLDYDAFYRTLPCEEAFERARKLLAEPGTEFVEAGASIRRKVAGDSSRPRLNVVIILEESLGSEFWGALGRKETLTPEMDRLASEAGMLFTNIYASGNRTVRGLEGVLSSFPPLPGESIVKRDLSANVETIARILKRDGYRSVFLYGGRGMFDGMRSFAVNNGWDRFIEQKHFDHPTFSTIWGVCDGDLMTRSIAEFRALSQAGQPFLGTILSVSNHKPYTYPTGSIPDHPEDHCRENAVKYSDYALGQFFKAAQKEPFWTNTVFVVVADHGARVYGSQRIPIRSYEIPLLIVGPSVVKVPSRNPQLGCSLDVSPTILGLIGRPYETLFFGRDLLKSPPSCGRVLLHHNRDVGFYANARMVVLGLRKQVEYWGGDPKSTEPKVLLAPTARELDMEKDCASLFQVADDLYLNRQYHLDP